MPRPNIIHWKGPLFRAQLMAALSAIDEQIEAAGEWGEITGTLASQSDLQTALDAKAAAVHTHAIADTTGLQTALDAKAPLASPTFTGTVAGVTKDMVGLGSVDNTSDASKPVSTATQTALDGKAAVSHTQTASTITDFSAAVAATTAVTENTAKVTNATHTGEVTGATALTIAAGAVTLAKQADMATASVVYRKTAGTGAPEVQTLATLKTDLGLAGTNSGDQASIAGITGTKAQFNTAVSDGDILYVGDVTQYTDEAAQDAVGAMLDASLTYVDATPLLQRAALTGHITAAAGSNATSLGSFTKAQLDTAVSDGNVAYVGDAPTAHTHLLDAGATDVTITAANLNILDDGADTTLHFHAADRARATHTGTQAVGTITGMAAIATSGSATDLGTGTLPAARFDDTAHGSRAGGTLHANAVAAGAAGFMTGADKTKLDGVATDANLYVHPNHSGDVTSTGDGATVIAADAVTNAKLANIATATIKGRVTAATGDPEDLTGTQATTLLDAFTTALKGLAPASGGGTSNFLRADGTWAAPPSGSSPLSGTLTATVGLAKWEHVETLTATGVTAASRIFLTLGAHTDTDQNDPEFLDILAMAGTPGTNVITVAMAFAAPTTGPIKLNWMAA